MPDLKSLDTIYLILAFIVPGLVASFVRAQFVTGRSPSHTEAALSYFVLSAIYYALALPAIEYALSIQRAGYLKAAIWIGLIFAGPAIFGLLLGISAQKGIFRRVLRWCRLNPVHVMPTAWDWKASTMQKSWVLVVLKDDTKFAGLCGVNSFLSTDQKERDLYLEKVYDVDDDNTWHPRENSVLITGGEIKTIEFWPYRKEESGK